MKVFVSYVENDNSFRNCITEIDKLPQNQEEIIQLEDQIVHDTYKGCHIPYIIIINIIPVSY